MKVEIINRMAGPAGNIPPGSIIELPDAEAEDIILHGAGRPVDSIERKPRQQPRKNRETEENSK